MPNKETDFKYTGVVGARKQLASSGVFLLLAFGVPFTILMVGDSEILPPWMFWFFIGGIILGTVLMMGGVFASDAKEN